MSVGLRKKCTQFSIVIALVAGVFFCQTRVSADVDTLSAQLYDKGMTTSVKTMISNYCSVVLSNDSFDNNQFVYNARYSVFVYLLCSNAASAADSELSNKYFARTKFSQLWFQDISSDENSRDLCSPMTNDCSLAKHIPNLFNDIMTDYTTIKQSTIYGLVGNIDGESAMETGINIFSQSYFGLDLCDTSLPHSYPKTCRTMKSYLKNSRNLLSDVRILSTSGVFAMWADNCSLDNKNRNILVCGLYGDTDTSFVSFVNLSYNERFYYRLFMGYYLLMLQQNPSTLLKNSQNRDLAVITKKFSTQYTRSVSAMSLTFRMLRDTAMAFPMHIGMEMYKEDLDGFAKLLAKIATPIYTLYDKLRNVQKPQ